MLRFGKEIEIQIRDSQTKNQTHFFPSYHRPPKGKRRRQSTRLEHLGIPEEELLRQQQELFAKARAEQETIEQEEWIKMQSEAIQQFESNAKVGRRCC